MGSSLKVLRATLIICAYRSISIKTHEAVIELLLNPDKVMWRTMISGEAGLMRARSRMASYWYIATDDDVFLMVDDDIVFTPQDAEKLILHCRAGADIVAAAYPVRDGSKLAVRQIGDDLVPIPFSDDEPLRQVRQVGTGFMAVHRRVLDALIPTLPLCNSAEPMPFWPLFDNRVIADQEAGGWNWLSEDFNFCELAGAQGLKVWLDPTITLKHHGSVPISVRNMAQVYQAIGAV